MTDFPATPSGGDRLERFHFQELDIRGALARLETAWQPVRTAQTYPPEVQRLLGELLTATALLASIIKIDGTLTVQAAGDGPLSAIMAECRNRDELRGIARIRDADAIEDGAGTGALGRGLITITIRPELGSGPGGRSGEPYQGIVPLDGSTLAEALEGYFARSEQIPTRIWLDAGGTRTAGMLIQALPPEHARHDHTPDRRAEDFGRITLLADTVTGPELRQLPTEQLLTRLFHEETVSLQPPRPLTFSCSCSRDRTREALQAMPAAELDEILEEEGAIHMTCQFCHAEYRFDAIDVALVHRDVSPDGDDALH